MCFFVTKSVTLTCCAPLILMGARYYYSRKVIQSYLDCALQTDMADIEAYYMTPTGKRREKRRCSCCSVTKCEFISFSLKKQLCLFIFKLYCFPFV